MTAIAIGPTKDNELPEVDAHPLDTIEISGKHRLFVSIIGLAAFFDFFDLMLAGAIAAALLDSGWSTLQLNAIFLSATGVGGVISNLSSGVLADRYGRRTIFRLALGLVGVSTLMAAFAPSMPWLIAWRFVASLGMAAIPALGFTLIAELLPAAARGRWSSITGVIGQTAILGSAAAAFLLVPQGGWRWMFVIPGIGCTALCFIATLLPESPRWLEAIGRTEQAKKALARIGASYGPDGPALQQQRSRSSQSFSALFRKPLSKRLYLAVTLTVGANVAMTAFLTWLPTILLERNFTIAHSLGYNLIISVGSPLGALIGAFIADRIGRKRGVAVIAALAAVLAGAFSIMSGAALLVTGFLFLILMGLLLSIIMGLYLPELFPTDVRARATAISMASVRFASIFLPFALLTLLKGFGVAGAMGLIAACLFALTFVTVALGVETAGKPLDRH